MKTTKLRLFIVLLIMTFTLSCSKDDAPPTPIPDPTSVTDIDGNVYPVSKICGKFWMTENLRTTKYNDGTTIPTGLSNTAWAATTTGACAVYGDLTANNIIYGKLYNWYAANNTKLAPTGWHVATEAEWIALIDCLGGTSVAGGKMKSTSSLWNTPNAGANNSSGFNCLPTGFKTYATGEYFALLNVASFWGSDQRNVTQGEYLELRYDFESVSFNGANKTFGYAVRCIKD
jgi:uncharacterized protein (TIGR02145 family)